MPNTRHRKADILSTRMYDYLPDSDAILAQFNRLMTEMIRGNLHRNTFRPWEIELLLDIESCSVNEHNRKDVLRRYQKAVQRHMEKGARMPLKLSEYLESVRAKRAKQEAKKSADVELASANH